MEQGGALINETTLTQKIAIRAYLLEHGFIDKKIAMQICDCDRLGARIYDLRHDEVDPMKIRTVKKGKKNRFGHHVRYATYELEREGEQESVGYSKALP